MFMQNPWQWLVWGGDGGFNGDTVCRRRPYNRGNLRDMVHSYVFNVIYTRLKVLCNIVHILLYVVTLVCLKN